MSLSPIGGGGGDQVSSIVTQIIREFFNGVEISSSGGDSPKINHIINLPEVSGYDEAIDNAIRQTVLRHMEDNDMLKGIGEGLGDNAAQGITVGQGTGLASSAIGFLQNPESLVAAGITKLPQATLVAFALSLIPIIINELTKPGGPWDLRFKRIVEKEFNALLNRQAAYDFSIGERGLIVQTRTGFLNRNTGGINANTLRTIREGGINKNRMLSLDYEDRSKGLY